MSEENKSENILEIKNIEVVYDDVILAISDVSLSVPRGNIVALLGGNGAGKSTTLKSVSTMLASERGKVTKGSIIYNGQQIEKLNPSDMVNLGLVQVLEGRRCFGHLTVEENIISGAYTRPLSKSEIKSELERMYAYFPRLKERRKSQAGFTSGGEQQMLTICRSLMGCPKLIMIDEPTEGLSPQMVNNVENLLKNIAKKGVSILLVEQKLTIAFNLSNRLYVMGHGRIVYEGTPNEIKNNNTVVKEWLEVS